MSDLLLDLLPDGGDVTLINGSLVLDDGLQTAVTISLFGGNEDDSGSDGDESHMWWGNFDEPTLANRYRSETQNLIRALPATPANMKRVEDAALRDLAWMLAGTADSVDVSVTIPALNHFNITIAISIRDQLFKQSFLRKSGASS